MDYYQKRQKAIQELQDLIKSSSQRLDTDELVFIFTEKYGFGRKFIEENLEILHKIGKISYNLGWKWEEKE